MTGNFSLRLKKTVPPEMIAILKRKGFEILWLHPVTGEFQTVVDNIIPDDATNVYAMLSGSLDRQDIDDLLDSNWVHSCMIEKTSLFPKSYS